MSSEKITLLFCINQRKHGRECCHSKGANELRKYAKAKAELLAKPVKVKKSDCLGHCKHGPVVQSLPTKDYYRCASEADIDLLFAAHVAQGATLKRLLIHKKK
ncbi:MAG TPA: (2Fe-2S) ferredoxin domain-containing protein [Methylophilaceae bacterium]|nr:(2Fe-2S) ferredoxin domain-containing protein [Methylophilaceae bacterium]